VSDATCAASSAVDGGGMITGIADEAAVCGMTCVVGAAGRWESAAASAGAVVGNPAPGGMMLAKADARAGGSPDDCCPGGDANCDGCPCACAGCASGRADVVDWGGAGCGAGGANAASLPRLRTHIPMRQSALRVAGRRRSSRSSIYSGSV
jgi:hypothetical protein